MEIEVRQTTGQGFQTDEAIDIGGHDRPIQAVGALYMGAGGHRGAAFRILRQRLKPAPDKALGANRINLHGKDDHPITCSPFLAQAERRAWR